MATISSPGIGSGLDVKSIVKQLVDIERQPLDKLKLQAANPAYEDIIPQEGQTIEVWGVVLASIKRFKT